MPDSVTHAALSWPAVNPGWVALADPADWPLVDPPQVAALLGTALEQRKERILASFAAQFEALRASLRKPALFWPRRGSPRFDRLLLVGQPRSGSASLTNLLRFVGTANRTITNLLQGDFARSVIAPFGDPFWFDLTPYLLPEETLSGTHAPPSPRLVESLRQRERLGIVLTVRDPRDAIVSFARLVAAGWVFPGFAKGAAPAEAQRAVITGRLFTQTGVWGEDRGAPQVYHVPSYLNWLQSALMLAELPNCIVLRYEEAFDQSDGRALFERLCQETICGVDWRDFEQAYHGTMLFRTLTGREPGTLEPSAHLARGEAGSWRDEWAADPALLDHPVVHAFCARFGYEMPDSRTPAGEPAGVQ